jgi:hypothetical protein
MRYYFRLYIGKKFYMIKACSNVAAVYKFLNTETHIRRKTLQVPMIVIIRKDEVLRIRCDVCKTSYEIDDVALHNLTLRHKKAEERMQ